MGTFTFLNASYIVTGCIYILVLLLSQKHRSTLLHWIVFCIDVMCLSTAEAAVCPSGQMLSVILIVSSEVFTSVLQ